MNFLDIQLNAQLQCKRADGLERKLLGYPHGALDLASNDYLQLSQHPHVREMASQALQEGSGARASRVLGGQTRWHESLEDALAEWKSFPEQTPQRALVFASGYSANLGVVTGLARANDCIFCDKRNHASLIDACRLAQVNGARVRFYHSPEKLRRLLGNCDENVRRIVVSDTVYSMDGDVADVPQLIEIAREFRAILVLDDAHGSGTLGNNGQGALHHFFPKTLPQELPPIVQLGTLSKALGAQGGFVVASPEVVAWLINSARSFIYSTGLSPVSCAAALGALQVLARESQRVQRLQVLALEVRTRLRNLNFDVPHGITPIVPIIAGSAHRALQWSRWLESQDIWCPCVRPPTVSTNLSRLRLSLHCELKGSQVDFLIEKFAVLPR